MKKYEIKHNSNEQCPEVPLNTDPQEIFDIVWNIDASKKCASLSLNIDKQDKGYKKDRSWLAWPWVESPNKSVIMQKYQLIRKPI